MPQSPSQTPRRALLLGLVASLCVHLALAGYLSTRPAPPSIQPAQSIEIEVTEVRARPPEVKPAPAAPSPAAPRPARPAPQVRAAPVQVRPQPEPPPVVGPPPTEPFPDGQSGGIAVAEAPTAPVADDLPRSGGAFGKLSLGLSRDTARLLTEPAQTPPDAGVSEAEHVKGRVDTLFVEAQALARSAVAVDSAVQGLGRRFERAATRASVAPDLQRWVDAALAGYRAKAKRFGDLGKERNEWDRIEDRALRDFDRSGATYVAIVQIRQGSDGGLLDLRLVASSGVPEFDHRALGSVADGLSQDATVFAVPRPEGTLSLWALLGDRQSDSEVIEGAKKVSRYLMLDVVDLKPTVIDLQRGRGTERLRFSTRLLAVF